MPQSRSPIRVSWSCLASWRTAGTNTRIVGSMGSMHGLWLVPKAGWGEIWSSSYRVSYDHLSEQPSPSQVNAPAPLYVTVLHWIWGSHYKKEDSSLRCRGHKVLQCSPGGAWGNLCWHLLKDCWWWLPHYRPPPSTCQELMWDMPAKHCDFTTRCEQLGLGEALCCRRQMGHSLNTASEWIRGNKYGHLNRKGTEDSSDLSVHNRGQ